MRLSYCVPSFKEKVRGQIQLQSRDSISLWGRMSANRGAWIKVIQLMDSLSVLYPDIQSKWQHYQRNDHHYQKQGRTLKLHCVACYSIIIYKSWTLLLRKQSFAKTSRHFDKDTTMAAGATVAFSLKNVYLLKPRCMHAFILQQHCISQESHCCQSKFKFLQ